MSDRTGEPSGNAREPRSGASATCHEPTNIEPDANRIGSQRIEKFLATAVSLIVNVSDDSRFIPVLTKRPNDRNAELFFQQLYPTSGGAGDGPQRVQRMAKCFML